jgi:hypothetical protein
MNRETFEKYVDEVVLSEIKKIRMSKGINYSGKEDYLKNFKTIGEELNISPEKVLWIYLRKHLDAIRSYIKEEYVDDTETIESRIYDAINYLLLLLGIVLEKGIK